MTCHIFDTDMILFLQFDEPGVGSRARTVKQNTPAPAVAGFTRVEFKGNYIQDLILLRNKVEDSDDLRQALVRINNTGGRRLTRMLSAFAKV